MRLVINLDDEEQEEEEESAVLGLALWLQKVETKVKTNKNNKHTQP
jgi:hypothetical protein